MNMRVYPFRAEGSLRAQPSKSAAHRLLICAALSDRETEIVLPALNADMEKTRYGGYLKKLLAED